MKSFQNISEGDHSQFFHRLVRSLSIREKKKLQYHFDLTLRHQYHCVCVSVLRQMRYFSITEKNTYKLEENCQGVDTQYFLSQNQEEVLKDRDNTVIELRQLRKLLKNNSFNDTC
jgi:hypothetical protein